MVHDNARRAHRFTDETVRAVARGLLNHLPYSWSLLLRAVGRVRLVLGEKHGARWCALCEMQKEKNEDLCYVTTAIEIRELFLAASVSDLIPFCFAIDSVHQLTS